MALPRCLGLELFCLISVVCSCRVAVFLCVFTQKSACWISFRIKALSDRLFYFCVYFYAQFRWSET